MKNGTVLMHNVIARHNQQRLKSVLDKARRRGAASREVLFLLEEKLDFGECVSPPDMPGDVVTMNSRFRVRDLNTNELRTFVLCYPDAVGRSHECLSVLEPIGCAALGRRAGDEIVAKSDCGVRRLQLLDVMY